jgi:hypothetical protein
MFFSSERIDHMREMILAETEEDRQKALDILFEYQKARGGGGVCGWTSGCVCSGKLWLTLCHAIRCRVVSFCMPLDDPGP